MMFGNLFLSSIFDLADMPNMTFFMSLISGGLLALSMVLVLRIFIVCWMFSKSPVITEFKKEFGNDHTLVFIVILSIFANLCLLQLQTEFCYEDILNYLLCIIYCSIFCFVLVVWILPYDDIDFAQSQNFKTSIGACWANGAVMAYYEESLNKFRARALKFEEDHAITLLVKKLVLIAPLSCNIEGSLSERDEKITYLGSLEPIERDEGANINRKLITSVYKIPYQNMDVYFAAEYPSPLGTLWGERYGMEEDVKIYIRDCFLKELRNQLNCKPVIILEYDDQNPSNTVPLSDFILSSLREPLEENLFYKKQSM